MPAAAGKWSCRRSLARYFDAFGNPVSVTIRNYRQNSWLARFIQRRHIPVSTALRLLEAGEEGVASGLGRVFVKNDDIVKVNLVCF